MYAALSYYKSRQEAQQNDPAVSAEEYYLRPDKPVAVTCNVYDLAWGADDKDGKKKKGNSGLPHKKKFA